MKKLFTLIVLTGLLMSCHIVTTEEPVKETEKAYVAHGVMTVTSSGFSKEDTRVKVVLKDAQKLDMYMFEVKFAEKMPVTIDMLISGIDYEKKGNDIHFACNDIVPTAGGKPYEKYIIKDMEGYITPDSLCFSNKYDDTPSMYTGVLTGKN